MFEGTPTQMNASLNRLRDLPPETRMFCGHEYTAANLRFALTVEPANRAALEYRDRVERSSRRGPPKPAVAAVARTARQSFFALRQAADAQAAAETHAGRPLRDPAEVFGVLRAWKDQFR